MVRVENSVDAARCRGGELPPEVVRAADFDAVAVDPMRVTLGMLAATIRALGLAGRWSEWRGVTVYGPATLHVFDRFQTLDVTEAAGDTVRVGRLLLEHLQLVYDPATGRLGRSPANGGEWVLDLF